MINKKTVLLLNFFTNDYLVYLKIFMALSLGFLTKGQQICEFIGNYDDTKKKQNVFGTFFFVAAYLSPPCIGDLLCDI